MGKGCIEGGFALRRIGRLAFDGFRLFSGQAIGPIPGGFELGCLTGQHWIRGGQGSPGPDQAQTGPHKGPMRVFPFHPLPPFPWSLPGV
jgi:hypothetical protein